MTKFVMQIGNASIDVEGDYIEVRDLVEMFWQKNLHSILKSSSTSDDQGGELEIKQKDAAGLDAGKRPKTKTKSSSGGAGKPSELENEVANKIKKHAKAEIFNNKVILRPADWLRKIEMVMYVSESPVHSGTISRVLTAVGVKNSLPTISKTLSANKASFITGGTTPETYDFTAASRVEFETWLSAKERQDG